MTPQPIAERTFVVGDQEAFAAMSGDYNPMHMDALFARRTMAAFPVVHGIHLLLWSLERFCAFDPEIGLPASLKVTFQKMVYVDDGVRLVLADRRGTDVQLHLMADDVRVTTIRLGFGVPAPATYAPPDKGNSVRPTQPVALSFEQMAEQHGQIPFGSSRLALNEAFPNASRVFGDHRLAALACSSYLVGMVCPGLHSIYSGLSFKMLPVGSEADALSFRTTSTDPRFRLIKLAANGGGWSGTIDAFARPEPVTQPSVSDIAQRLEGDIFANTSVLVVGGSRGLGELVAKIAAAGKADVTITYAAGEADAERVKRDIQSAGGRCAVVRYDVRQDPGHLVAELSATPDAVYYLATPPIFQKKGGAFSASLLDTFLAFYVTGFNKLCRALKTAFGASIPAFYPSSVAVETRPANMTEYAMAKAAGEILCADMPHEGLGPVLVRRLPRLATDQTATVRDTDVADSLEVMLPIVRELHAIRAVPMGRSSPA